MFLDLLPEIQEVILSYCSVRDVQTLSRTCSEYNEAVKPFLFHTVKIQGNVLHQNVDRQLENFKYMNVLKVSDYYIPEGGFESITKLMNLHELHVKWSNIGDMTLSIICEGLPKLQILDIGRTRVTDSGLVHLQKLSLLEELVVYQCKITEIGLSHLAGIPTLKSLDLSSCHKISNAGFAHLSSLSSLKKLTLDSCEQIEQLGISYISKVKTLKNLSLNSLKIPDECLGCIIENLPLLKELSIILCSNLSAERISFYQKKAPSVKIKSNPMMRLAHIKGK